MRKFIISLFVLILFFLSAHMANAQQGCCSWHGGISHCDTSVGTYVCNDGSYSPSCGCYYAAPAPPTPTFPSSTQASWNFVPNTSPNKTFTVTITLDDSNPTQYSVVLSKCKGCNPGPLTDFYSNKFIFIDVKPGTWYLNVKKAINGVWSNTVYWTISVPGWIEPTPTPTPIAVATTNNQSDGVSPIAGGLLALFLLGLFVGGIIVMYKLAVWFFRYAKEHDWVWGVLIWGALIGGSILIGIFSSNTNDATSTTGTSKYNCNCSKTCPNMTCAEAYYQLEECGCSVRDGDGDGVPCEAQCR